MNTAQETHFQGRVAQKVLLVKDNTVLITRDSRDEVWELPGGRLNVGESPQEGVMREVQEELGVAIQVGRVVYVNQFTYTTETATALVLVYEATMVDEQAPFVADPVEVAQMAWVDATTWDTYEYYPEYRAALSAYFAS